MTREYVAPGVFFSLATCAQCRERFLIADDLMEVRKRDHADFFCPNGHAQYYTGGDRKRGYSEASPVRELRAKLARLNVRLARAEGQYSELDQRYRLLAAMKVEEATPVDAAELAHTEVVERQRDDWQVRAEEAEECLSDVTQERDALRAERDTALLRAVQWEYSAELNIAKLAEVRKKKAVPAEPPLVASVAEAVAASKVESLPDPAPLAKVTPPISPMLAMCTCGHAQRRHDSNEGICGGADCACSSFALVGEL